MKLFAVLLAFSLPLFLLNGFSDANPSRPSSPSAHLPFPANNFVVEALKGFNLVKSSNYLVDFMHLTGENLLKIFKKIYFFLENFLKPT